MARTALKAAVTLLVTVFLAGCGGSLGDGLPSSGHADGSPTAGSSTVSVPPVAAAPEIGLRATTAGGEPVVPAKLMAPVAPMSATPVASPAAMAGAMPSAIYRIGPQDVLEVSVYQVAELNKIVAVSETGRINLPLLGEVQAAGRTPQELEREITSLLKASYLQRPQVNVGVREYNSQRVTIEGGGVKKPGLYPLRGRMTLLQLIATAEGLTEISDAEVAIFRERGGKRTAVRFDISAVRSGTAEDPTLMAGDVIVATTSTTKEAFNTVLKALPIATVLRPF